MRARSRARQMPLRLRPSLAKDAGASPPPLLCTPTPRPESFMPIALLLSAGSERALSENFHDLGPRDVAILEIEPAEGMGGGSPPLGRRSRIEQPLAGHAFLVDGLVAVAIDDDPGLREPAVHPGGPALGSP